MTILKQVLWFSLIVIFMLSARVTQAADIDFMRLVQDTQLMSKESNEMLFVWWLPEEYWKVSLSQHKGVTSKQIEDFLKVIRPYTIIVVTYCTIGTFGGITYKSEEWIRENTRLIDNTGTTYTPITTDEIDADANYFLQLIKPFLIDAIGLMGENMHFLLFPAKTANGTPIADATKRGNLKIKMGNKEFQWRLPLESLLPMKICPKCKQECKGSWIFCPWCGKKLEKK